MIVLGDLKVVDIEMALNTMGGYEHIYQKVVNQFIQEQANLVNDVYNNLLTNRTEARRLVHSCKGISRNIGSKALYEVTLELENAILEENEILIKLYFEQFKAVFTEVMADLSKIKF